MHDNTVKYSIAPVATFVKIHVAQNYIVSLAATFDPSKVSAQANDPSDATLDRTKGKVHYDQAIPAGTHLVLYGLKSGMSDDGTDASYEPIQVGTPLADVA